MNIDQLKSDYEANEPYAQRLLTALQHELGQLLKQNSIALGVPLEGRVKSWDSLRQKLDRKSLTLTSSAALDDLVGVRSILLFRSDLDPVLTLIHSTFDVLSVEDTASRLADSQFGYQSKHLIIQLPKSWANIPSFSGLSVLKAEIQVRTLAQHIWAAASHKLQYKQEDSVPPPLRRTIYRISALLETVDLELDRVLDERKTYTAREITQVLPNEPLNVDLLAAILDSTFPPENKRDDEDYADLLFDLLHFNIRTTGELKAMFARQKVQVMKEESNLVGGGQNTENKKVYFRHVGLGRVALRREIGDDEFTALHLTKTLKK